MIFYLHPALQSHFNSALPLFDQLMSLTGERFRFQDGRITQKVMIGEKTYFIKQHFGVGYKEIFKNLLQGRWPIISAKNEWQALQKCAANDIAAPKLVGFGERGLNPASRQSFVLMEAILPSISLEEECLSWRHQTPSFSRKLNFIKRVAELARKLHENGMNHRDFYLCHFLLNQTTADEQLHLIDLHRSSLHGGFRTRWIIKDLAGLYFSAQNIGLTQRDFFRFMKNYRNKGLNEILSSEHDFWRRVKSRGEKLYHEHNL